MNLPNHPCECGSGRKQKQCHPLGAPEHGCEREPKTKQQTQRERRNMAGLLSLAVVMAEKGLHR